MDRARRETARFDIAKYAAFDRLENSGSCGNCQQAQGRKAASLLEQSRSSADLQSAVSQSCTLQCGRTIPRAKSIEGPGQVTNLRYPDASGQVCTTSICSQLATHL